MVWQGVINRFHRFLPVSEKTPVVTLNEGDTRLIKLKNLPDKIGADFEVYAKFEGLNPTGSFKDRGMTVAISKAKEEAAAAVICASTGNTSASAAAYSAAAGLTCIVLLPEGAIALGKLSQAMLHNAKVLAVKGNFDDALNLVRAISSKYPVKLVNSINPYRIEGQKTAAFEVSEALGRTPDYLCIPVGNAGNITAYWKGFKEIAQNSELQKDLKISGHQPPRMCGFQAAGAAPIVEGHPISQPETIATAIRIGNPASWQTATAARDESGGIIDKVTDEEIVKAYKMLAACEGLFCEPASAASVAGLIKYHQKKYFPKGATVVCVLTGHGLKDPDRAIACSVKPKVLPADLTSIVKELGL
jgi:threonine synthase